MRIGIIGGGVVGGATARALIVGGHDVLVHDLDPLLGCAPMADITTCELILLCLPTPWGREEPIHTDPPTTAIQPGLDTSIIDAVCRDLRGSPTTIALRSTVPVGTTRRLRAEYDLPNLVHWPEFLTARTAEAEALVPSRLVIGGASCNGKWVLNRLLRQRFPGARVLFLTSDQSEAVKLITNTWFAVKVAAFNEFRTLVDALGLDWPAVHEAVVSDPRIPALHTKVPGHDGRRGFGGACLPKDLGQFIAEMATAAVPCVVAAAARMRNDVYDRPRDRPEESEA